MLYVSTGGDHIDNATSTSPSRRKLYEEGKYMPKSYMLAWGKRAQIDWAISATRAEAGWRRLFSAGCRAG